MSAFFETNFYARQVDGTVENRSAYINDQTENDAPGLKITSDEIEISKLTIRGSVAEAAVAYVVIGTYAANGIQKPLRGLTHATDEWALDAGTWKLRSTTMHDTIVYVDGKVMQDEREQFAPTAAAIAGLRSQAVIIPTLALDADPDQFNAIGAAIGDARIVGMGEGSHGSSEFFAFKNRLFKYLVEKKGFTVFAMEAFWGAGLDVDRYIKGGRGTAQQAVASLQFWTWATPEVVDLVRWMHDYNAKPGNHPTLSFAGIDMQDPMGAIGYLATFLSAHDPSEAAAARAALECAAGVSAAQYTQAKGEPVAGCREKVAAIGGQVATLDAPDAAMARQAVTNILQYLDWKAAGGGPDIRDRNMAENVEWLAAYYPHANIAVWAHNGHIGASSNELSYRTMGTSLRQAFGKQYYTIGQTFGSGTVRAIVRGHGLQPVTVPAGPNDTTAALFAPLGSVAFVDLRGLRAGSALQKYFSGQHGVEEIGAGLDPQRPESEKLPMVIPNSFDGLVYVPISSAAIDGVQASQMQREVQGNGAAWQISGVGFDDVTATTTGGGARLTNRDELNATPDMLARRFDAAPYLGQTVQVTGEVRYDDLLGFVFPSAEVVTAGGSVVGSQYGKPIGAAPSWTPFTLTLNVPLKASFIDAGVDAEGLGSIEVRGVTVAVTRQSGRSAR